MRKAPGPRSPGTFVSVRLERVGDKSADDAAGKCNQHRIVARAHPMIAIGRCTQVITIWVRDHHVVACVAAVEPLAALPTMCLEAVVLHEALVDDDPLVDLLVAAAVVMPAEVGSGGRSCGEAGESHRSAGKC